MGQWCVSSSILRRIGYARPPGQSRVAREVLGLSEEGEKREKSGNSSQAPKQEGLRWCAVVP